MTDKELVEVSNRAWDAFVDQLPEEITGRDLLKIIINFVVNIANATDMKPTSVCMFMLDVKIFDVGCMYILAYWALEFVMKVIDRWL